MKRSLFVFAVLALLPGGLPAAADVPPAAGPNFQVNGVAQLSQSQPDVAQDAAGNFVIVWADQSATPTPPTLIKARLFAASGAPTSGEIIVAQAVQTSSPPRVAMTPLGEFDVVWEDRQNIFLRHFDRLGRTAAIAFDPPPPGVRHSPDVAMDAAGNAFVVWAEAHLDGDLIMLQRFGADGFAVGAPEQVNAPVPYVRDIPRIAVSPADSLLVSWNDHRAEGGLDADVWARRFDGPSGAWSPEIRINQGTVGFQKGSAPILYPEEDGAVVFNDFAAHQILIRRLDATGAFLGDPIPLGDLGPVGLFTPDAAAGPDGTALVAWLKDDNLVHVGFFGRAWNPLGGDFVVSSETHDLETDPVVAAGAPGSFVVAWTSNGVPSPIFPFLVPDGRDGSGAGIFAQRFQSPACVAGSEALCLDSGRFQARVSWKNPFTGETGTGRSLPLTGDTGSFWFFDPSNLELMIKVLDARAVNGHFWVFYGSLSNVEYTLTVTDTVTHAVKTYHNAPFQFGSQADIAAFSSPPGIAADAGVAGIAAATAPPPPPVTAFDPALFAAPNCTPSLTSLCAQSRFQVQVDFVDPRTGAAGQGQAVPLTVDTGVFWFFAPTNLEVMVKVLDGSAVNGYFWVFYGALSDVEYTITVTDTATGARRTYHNPLHHLASGADVTAFTAGPTAR